MPVPAILAGAGRLFMWLMPKSLGGLIVKGGIATAAYSKFRESDVSEENPIGPEGSEVNTEMTRMFTQDIDAPSETFNEFSGVLSSIDETAISIGKFVRSPTDGGERLIREGLKEHFGIALPPKSSDGSTPAGPSSEEESGFVPAIKTMLNGGGVSEIASAYAGKDGWGVGDVAALGGGTIASLFAGNWFLSKLFGKDDDKDNNKDSGFGFASIALTMALTVAAVIGYQHFTQDNDSEGYRLADNDMMENRSLISSSFFDAHNGSSNIFRPKISGNTELENPFTLDV